MKQHHIATILAGALIGAFYWWVWAHFWGMHAADNSLDKWLLDINLHRNNLALFRLVIWSHDVVVNVLFAVPFASMFMLGARFNNWLCVTAAVLVANAAMYWGTEWMNLSPLLGSWGFWAGLGMSLLSLPAAFLIVRAVCRLMPPLSPARAITSGSP